MRCSVVIPCHGGAALTRACLESLQAQAGGHQLEFLLVDNLGDPATQALAAPPTVEVLVQRTNLGFAGGCNAGLARVRLPFALVLNNDTLAAPHLLSRLEAALLRDDRIAFAAPISNRVKGPARIDCGEHGRTAAGRAEIERELCDAHLGRCEDVDTLSGLCLLGRTATWRELQGFDARFMPGNFEDDDLSLRARLRGHRLVIARDAFLHHEAHQTFAALGIDVTAEIHRQHAVFADKWRHDPAGEVLLCAFANDRDGAVRAARRARRLHADWPDADWHLGRDHVAHGRWADAVPHLLALLRRCPNHHEALIQLGRCWLELGEHQRTQRLWRWALAACAFAVEQGTELLTLLGDAAQRSGDYARAAADFAAAVELRPADGTLLNRLGAVLIELRRFDEAIPVLERAAAAGLALAQTNLGICHFHAGDSRRALEHFAAAAAQLPDDPTAQQNYARARAAAPLPSS